jgi:hypothetical protein
VKEYVGLADELSPAGHAKGKLFESVDAGGDVSWAHAG